MLALRSQAPGSPGRVGRDDGLQSPPWKEDARNGAAPGSSMGAALCVLPLRAGVGPRRRWGEHRGPTERSQAGVRHDQGSLARGAQRRATEKTGREGT